MSAKIRDINIERGEDGEIKQIKITFGPHYFVGLEAKNERVICYLGATHHGIKADASEVNGELEQFIEELKDSHPQNEF